MPSLTCSVFVFYRPKHNAMVTLWNLIFKIFKCKNEIRAQSVGVIIMFILQFGQNTYVHLKDLIYLFQKMVWITWF